MQVLSVIFRYLTVLLLNMAVWQKNVISEKYGIKRLLLWYSSSSIAVAEAVL